MPRWPRGGEEESRRAYREEGVNDVCLDGAEGLVFDDDEDLLLFFQVYEVTEPRFLGKPVYIKDGEKTHDYVFFQ